MIPKITASQVYSTLGNSNSLVPLAMKDIVNSIGLTAGSYITGDATEGRDRFIDEFGTQAIWLFGIPTYKKVLDYSLFKTMGYDPKVDVRVLKNPDIFEKAKQYAPNAEIKKAFEKIGDSPKSLKTFKGLSFGRFVASTFLTILSYYGLTKYRHNATEQHIKENYLKKHKQAQLAKKAENSQNEVISKAVNPQMKFSKAFNGVHKNSNGKPSFTGIQDFMFSPTKNLMIVDGSITAERICESRNPQDMLGYVIKEGSFWAFMYFLGDKIQKHFENKTEQKHGMNIQLDARVIESEELKSALKDKELKTTLQAFSNLKKDADIYDFVVNPMNKDNIIVKMAKMSDIISVTDKKDLLSSDVDTRAFIDLDEIKGVKDKLGKLYDQFNSYKDKIKLSQSTGEVKDKVKTDDEILSDFMKSLRKYKRGSVLKNIGTCIAALGVVAPGLMVALRFADKKNRKFQVQEEVEKKLEQDLKSGKIKV